MEATPLLERADLIGRHLFHRFVIPLTLTGC
jgi:hypothetical protein